VPLCTAVVDWRGGIWAALQLTKGSQLPNVVGGSGLGWQLLSKTAGSAFSKPQFPSSPHELAGAGGTTSTAPMSQALPCGREVPRWSTLGQLAPASTTGLLLAGSKVSVCPPLFWSAPSFGSVF
jgi:hypothetical protein